MTSGTAGSCRTGATGRQSNEFRRRACPSGISPRPWSPARTKRTAADSPGPRRSWSTGTDLFAEPARPARLACPALPASERGRRRLAEPSDLRQALKRAAEAGAAGTSGCSATWRDAAGPGMAAPRRFRRDGENPTSTKGTASPVGVRGAACCNATPLRTRVIRARTGDGRHHLRDNGSVRGGLISLDAPC